MARPLKEGMDYFPHDTDASDDEKIEAFEAIYGVKGYAFYFKLLERIYKTPAGEFDTTNEARLKVLIKRVAKSEKVFKKMIFSAFSLDLFDKQAYEEKNILTSNGIKKRFAEIAARREKWRTAKEGQERVFPQENGGENQGENGGENPDQNPESSSSKALSKSTIKDTTTTLPADLVPVDEVLSSIPGWPANDNAGYLIELQADFGARVDLLDQAKSYRLGKQKNPITAKHNPRLQFRNWLRKAIEFAAERKGGNPHARTGPGPSITPDQGEMDEWEQRMSKNS